MKNILDNFKNFKIDKKVFKPTGTSKLLLESSLKHIKKNHTILDLGCGSGVIGISIAKKLNLKSKVYFSDVSRFACKNTIKNCKKMNIDFDVREGSVFEPWKKMKFDVIVSDVAAVAEKVSKISPWYKNCINGSGPEGTKHIFKILNNAKFFLKKRGFLIIPVISLSNEKKIISKIKVKFKNYRKIHSQSWILPNSMAKKIKILERLKKRGSIFFEKKLGIITFKTKIYLMVNK